MPKPNPSNSDLMAAAVVETFDVRGSSKTSVSEAMTTAAALLSKSFPPVKYVAPGYIVEGCTLLSGNPKIGKSWMALQIAMAVATGGSFLGDLCQDGSVLYLALEDNERRLQSRIQLQLSDHPNPSSLRLDRLFIKTTWPRSGEGGLEAIIDWLDNHPDARLIAIDVLAAFRSAKSASAANSYAADYETIRELQRLASERSVAILVVHHNRKGSAENGDKFEKVSGTFGLSGAADSILVLNADATGKTIYGRGRDIEEIEKAVRLDTKTCRWMLLGEASDVYRSDERKSVIDCLTTSGIPLSPTEIALQIGKERTSVQKLVGRMVKDDELSKVGSGKYAIPALNPNEAPPPPYHSGHSCHSWEGLELDLSDTKVLDWV